MMINVLQGDITQVPVNAIATLINSGGLWFGGVDRAITSVAGDYFHAQAGSRLKHEGLVDGQVVVAGGNAEAHGGQFNDVVFVVDDLERPVGELVSKVLETARMKGYKSIALPAMRTGVMLGVYPDEPDFKTTVRAVAGSLRRFMAENEDHDLTVWLVIYRDQKVLSEFKRLLEDNAARL